VTASRLHITVSADAPVIEFQRVVAATPALVFELWTNPDHLRNWWGPRDHELVSIDIDLRVGGRYRYVHRAPDGVEHAFHGTYRELDPPRVLVQTTVYESAPDNQSLDHYTFDEHPGGTLIRCRSEHSSLAVRDMYVDGGMERGLAESHRRLDALIVHLAHRSEGCS
jgi:uncharacterized protein YndB with AHSA1/START domain